MIRPTGLTAIRRPDAPTDGWYAVVAFPDGPGMELVKSVRVERGSDGSIYIPEHEWHTERLDDGGGALIDGEPTIVGLFHQGYFPEGLNSDWSDDGETLRAVGSPGLPKEATA